MNGISRYALVASLLLAGSTVHSAGTEALPPRGSGPNGPTVSWITLGTVGGPPLHAQQAAIANALAVGDEVYLFDVGNGVLRQLDAAGLKVRNLRGVFITHHHVDHNADLGLVILQNWTFESRRPLPVLGPPGTTALVAGLVKANAATELAAFAVTGAPNPPLASAVDGRDLPALIERPTDVYVDANIRVSAVSVEHFQMPPVGRLDAMPTAVAYRVEAGGRSFVYTGDTGPTTRLRLLADGADVLLSEVVDLQAIQAYLERLLPGSPTGVIDGLVANMARNHLEPEFIGRLASDANVKEVVLTHFVPSLADMPDPMVLSRRVAEKYSGRVTLAHDLARF